MQDSKMIGYASRDPNKLQELIRRHGMRSRECQQIAQRLKDLLPAVLKIIRKERPCRGAAAERLALLDPSYTSKIEEYLQVRSESLTAKIQCETHSMLLKAQQSVEAFHRVAGMRDMRSAHKQSKGK